MVRRRSAELSISYQDGRYRRSASCFLMERAGEEMTTFSGSLNRQRMAGDIPYLAVPIFKAGLTWTMTDGRTYLPTNAGSYDRASSGTITRAVRSSSHRGQQLKIAQEDPRVIPKSFARVASTRGLSGDS